MTTPDCTCGVEQLRLVGCECDAEPGLPTVTTVYFGAIDAMIDEVAALDMGQKWFREHKVRYAVLPCGNQQWNTEYFSTIKGAREEAKYLAKFYGAKICHV